MDCNICKPIRSDDLDFSQVHSLLIKLGTNNFQMYMVQLQQNNIDHLYQINEKRKQNSVLLVNLLEMLE